MIQVVLDQSWRYQHELMFNLTETQMDTRKNIYRQVYILWVRVYTEFLALQAKRVWKQ